MLWQAHFSVRLRLPMRRCSGGCGLQRFGHNCDQPALEPRHLEELTSDRTECICLTTMASFLISYGIPEAMKVARDLDAKVEALLNAAAS